MHKVSDLALQPLCDCHRSDSRVIRMLRELAPLPDLLAEPQFHSAAEASTWAALFLAVLKTSDHISEAAFEKAVDRVHALVKPAPLPSYGMLVIVERGSRAGMVPHLFRAALPNALAHDPRGSSLVMAKQALPMLFETSLLPPVFHLVSYHAHRDEAKRCAPLTMRLYDNGQAGLTASDAFLAARALIEDSSN